MKCRTRLVETEYMQWEIGNSPQGEMGSQIQAVEIAAWVNTHGGWARYEPEHYDMPDFAGESTWHPARIAISGRDHLVSAKPGDYIVMGAAHWCMGCGHSVTRSGEHIECQCQCLGTADLREFQVLTRDEFERDWEAIQ